MVTDGGRTEARTHREGNRTISCSATVRPSGILVLPRPARINHMAHWEYKVITSGKGGFASPAMLEKFLNDLGREEWEIIHYLTPPDNALAFTGLARRSTQRDWTLEDAAAAAAKAEADKLRAEFEAKFRAAASPAAEAPAEERSAAFIEDKSAAEEGLRKLVDTSRDGEPEAEEPEDDWDKLTAAEEEELPTFFEAIRPHMRRNQRGPGMSVGVEFLAKKWDQSEDDVKGALVECGFVMPADEDSPVEHLEYDGDLYWLNINRRGELWINTKEKPRQIFKAVKGTRIEPPPAEVAPAPVEGAAPAEAGERKPAENTAGDSPRPAPQPLPEGTALIEKIRPHLRRNRRGPGGSGSLGFLARALRVREADLKAAFGALGLTMPATQSDQPVYTDIATEQWWLNLDSRGGLWINGREKREGEPAPAGEAVTSPAPDANIAGQPAPEAASTTSSGEPAPLPASVALSETPAPVAEPATPAAGAVATPAASVTPLAILDTVRPFLKETRTGAIAGSVGRLAGKLEKPVEEFIASLVTAGLKVPEKPREKPVYVGHASEQFWFNLSGKGELWLNVRAAKAAGGEDEESDGDADEAEEDSGEKPTSEGRKPARRGRARSSKKAD